MLRTLQAICSCVQQNSD